MINISSSVQIFSSRFGLHASHSHTPLLVALASVLFFFELIQFQIICQRGAQFLSEEEPTGKVLEGPLLLCQYFLVASKPGP